TVHEALAAADSLAAEGIRVRVIDAYSIKPIDAATLRTAAAETSCLITIEDHWPEGGLGEAVLSALADERERPPVVVLGGRNLPASATPAEQRAAAGIDAAAIARMTRAALVKHG